VLFLQSAAGSGFRLQGLKPKEPGNSGVAAKECPEKVPPLQKAQEWATRVQRQRVPQSATYKSAAMVAEWRRSVKRRGVASEKDLTYSYMGMYCLGMARAATTSDAFNAVAEPRRREILQFLATGERSVGEIVMRLGGEQPSVSKHLRVLLEVKLVDVRRDGRHMLYRANAEAIRPLHEWTSTFERLWKHQLSQVKIRAEKKNTV